MTKPSLPSSSSKVTGKLSTQELVARIKTHIAKGDQYTDKSKQCTDKADQHYKSAGQYLHTLKGEHEGSWAEWEELLKTKVGIGKSRASELMQIADGRKTVQEVRADTAKRVREKNKRDSSPLANGETGNREGNGAAEPETAADEGDLNLKAMANKIAADAAALKAKRDQEEREAQAKREAESTSNVVAAVAERAAQAEADARDAELAMRESKAQAVQALPGSIGPLLNDDESGAPDSQSDVPITLQSAIAALIWWGKHVASLENMLPEDAVFGKSDLSKAIDKLRRLNDSKAMAVRRKAQAAAAKAAKAAAR